MTMTHVQGMNSSFNVYVQGSLLGGQGKTVFLTVHDVGTNRKSVRLESADDRHPSDESLMKFVNHPSMRDVKSNSVFLHVCVPGQEDHARDFTDEFPSLEQLGDELIAVLEWFEVRNCVAIGVGAGAYIVSQFAATYPNHILGLVLVDFISQAHKKGTAHEAKLALNATNVNKYLHSYKKSADAFAHLAPCIGPIDALLAVGANSPHASSVHNICQHMNKQKTTLLVVDGVLNVMTEAPGKLARGLILMCKGCGLLPQIGIPGLEKQRSLSSSMEEADRSQTAPSLARAHAKRSLVEQRIP
ncbi:Ndr [Aphelenchoides avenae]|nr:Ndr [Aphelenchus avenae]